MSSKCSDFDMRKVSSVWTLWSCHHGAFNDTQSTDNRCVLPPNLGGGVDSAHTHTPPRVFNPLIWGWAPIPEQLGSSGQHAESGLQEQISLRRPDASEPGWRCGVKIKQTPVPKKKKPKGGQSQTEGLIYPAADTFSASCHSCHMFEDFSVLWHKKNQT